MRGILLVLAGPSGVGKGTIGKELLARDPRLSWSVSATTREPRPGEIDGVDYRFLDRAEFERLRDEGGLLEWFEVYGQLKGTPRAPVEESLSAGRDMLLEIDGSGKEIAELERRMRVNDQVVRYITVRVDEDRQRADKFKAKRQRKASKRPGYVEPTEAAAE